MYLKDEIFWISIKVLVVFFFFNDILEYFIRAEIVIQEIVNLI